MTTQPTVDSAHHLISALPRKGTILERLQLPPEQRLAGTIPEINRQNAVTLLTQSVQQFLHLAELARALDTTGRNSSLRNPELTEAIMCFAALDVSQRYLLMQGGQKQRSGKPLVSPEEAALYILTHSSHRGELPMPAWAAGIHQLFQPRIEGREVPTLSQLVSASPSASQDSRELLTELATIQTTLDDARKTDTVLDFKTEGKLMERFAQIEKALLHRCERISDVDPIHTANLTDATKIGISLTPVMISHGIDLLYSIRSLLQYESTPQTNITAPVLVLNESGTPAPIIIRAKVPTKASPQQLPEIESLGELYLKLRASLVQLMSQAERLVVADPALQAQYHPLWRNFAHVFGEDKVASLDLLEKLAALPSCAPQVLKLCSTEMIATSAAGIQSSSMLNSADLFPLLPAIARGIILDTNLDPLLLDGKARAVRFSRTLEFFQRARAHYQQGNVDGLIQAIGNALSPSIEGERLDAYVTLGALITLDMLLSMPEHRAKCKARPKIVSKLTEATTMLQNEFGSWAPSSSKVITSLTQRISRHMMCGLADYWGAKPLVTKVTNIVSRHLDLLHHPEAWEGLTPNRVFTNGYLLFGPGGSGKSFLLRCLAQEFDLPLLEIGKDDLIKRRESLQKNGKEVTIAEVLDKVVEELRIKVKKSGNVAGMLVLNEFEEMAPRKDRVGGDAEMLELTTALLRKFEVLIPNTQDILICATANNIEIIEPTMIRPGRFGFKIEVTLPDRDGVQQIVTSNLSELDQRLQIDPAQWDALLKVGVGLTPEVLKIAITQAVIAQRIGEHRNDAQVPFESMMTYLQEGRELSVLSTTPAK